MRMFKATSTLLLLLLFAILAARPAAAQLAVGETPAAVTVADLEGEPFELASVIGQKPTLVQFWATWCAVCKALEPRIRAEVERYGEDLEVLVVAVGVAQTLPQVKAHVARMPAAGTMLWDAEGAAVRAFDAPETGVLIMLDAAGRVVGSGAGAQQDVAALVAKGMGGRR
ncbi:MAG: TlpA disulfide reductase family protein [Gemmatimonadota bacterium]